jgi:DNA-binding SARP family transcriptional activator
MLPTCAVRLLGGFTVEVDGRPVAAEGWRHRRGADLVKLLALAPGHRLHREQVQAALWPDLEPEPAGANLRKAVHFARRALGAPDAIAVSAEMLDLWPEGELAIDVELFETAARQAIAYARAGELVKAHRCLADAESLVGMWQGGPRRAATREARAFVRGAEGDRVQASALFREAATLFADAGRAIDERRCREEADDLPRLTTSD